MTRFRGLFIFSILLLAIVFPGQIFGAEKIENFDVSIIAHRNGTMDVTEKITYDFSNTNKHGIFRDVSTVSRVGNLYRVISVNFQSVLRDGQPENFAVSQGKGKISAKIGKADQEVSGPHTYTIFYSVSNGVGSNYMDHDELYWNVTGNSWQAEIVNANVKIITDSGTFPNKVTCYTGPEGSTQQNCDSSLVSSVATRGSLHPTEGLTVVWSFPKSTFPPSILQTTAPDTGTVANIDSGLVVWPILFWLVLLNLILAPALFIWYQKHKRKERFGPPAVNFDIPTDNNGIRITPAEAGSIDIYRVDRNDVVATIFDLAIRKYLKVEQVKKEKQFGIFGQDEDYYFEQLNKPGKEITVFEELVWKRLFRDGNKVPLSSLKPDFYTTFTEFEKSVFSSLVGRGFYGKNPKIQMSVLLASGIVIFLAGGVFLGPLVVYLSCKLNGRTATGDQVDWKLDGLKLFLKNMTRYYTFQTKNLITVEKYIPYAIAFGMINEFMDQLKEIDPVYRPSWYSGSTPFYSAAITGNMFSSMNTSFTTTAPSSSSGFSGGGFSGGGGGGGGGGSW